MKLVDAPSWKGHPAEHGLRDGSHDWPESPDWSSVCISLSLSHSIGFLHPNVGISARPEGDIGWLENRRIMMSRTWRTHGVSV
jgi:hypothetical protein